MTVEVRAAQPADVPQLIEFQLALAQESEGRSLDAATLAKGITGAMEVPGRARYWVLEDIEAKKPVGMCMVTWEWSDWNNSFYWWLQSVYVASSYRGQGLLGKLIEKVETDAQAEGAASLRLYVALENPRAIKAYEKLGFVAGHYQVMEKKLSGNCWSGHSCEDERYQVMEKGLPGV